MPDSEIAKMVLQGGSFALLAMIVIGTLRYAPAFIAAMNKLGTDHTIAIESINAANGEHIDKINAANRINADILATSHKDAVATLVKDCREERRELVQRLIAETKS